HERLGGVEQLAALREERAFVADHLELDPVCVEGLARELGGEDRVAGGEAACGVREQRAACLLQYLDNRAARRRVHAAQRHRRELGARRRQRLGHRLEAAEAAGAEDEARAELAPGDRERAALSHPAPPGGPPRAAPRAARTRPTRRGG